MFALILKEGYSFHEYETEVSEYFDFLRDRSSSGTNNDGYGIIAYKAPNECDLWYKTGSNVWYGNGDVDPLDEAELAIIEENSEYNIVIAHARNATGGSGSHPFVITEDENIYSMCHNGSIRSNLIEAIMQDLGESWFLEYPSNWAGVYGDAESFIDSELYFHYLMNRVFVENGIVFQGIKTALTETDLLWTNPAEELLTSRTRANFLFSDGIDLFAFRNTDPQLQSYRLSWQDKTGFIVVKTQELLNNELQKNELIKLSHDGSTVSEILTYEPEEPFIPVSSFYAYPNPFSDMMNIYLQKSRDQEENYDLLYSETVYVYNIKGQLVRVLEPVINTSSECYYIWNGRYENKNIADSGVYFFKHLSSGKHFKAVFCK